MSFYLRVQGTCQCDLNSETAQKLSDLKFHRTDCLRNWTGGVEMFLPPRVRSSDEKTFDIEKQPLVFFSLFTFGLTSESSI